MSQRVIVGLHPGADPGTVRKRLEAAGADSVQGPRPELPDVLIATVPDGKDANEFLQQAKSTQGVRYAEADAWRTTS